MKFKIYQAILLLFLLWPMTAMLAQGQTILINEDYDDGQVPAEWNEYNSSGKLINLDNRLAFRFEDNVDVHGVQSFTASGGTWYASFLVQTESSWSNSFITFLTPDSSKATELIVGGTNAHDGLEVVTAVDANGQWTESQSIMGSIDASGEYMITLAMDTETDQLDIRVDRQDGEESYEQKDISFIRDVDELGKLSVYIDYLWNSGSGDTRHFYLDNLLLTDVDKRTLALMIPEVTAFYQDAEPGDQPGTYPAEIYQELGDTLDMARAIYDSASVSSSRVNAMTANLESLFKQFKASVNRQTVEITIDTTKGHALNEGLSGYNVRIADSPWNYNHPVFREGVEKADPGFLRYFSGTTGDYFDMNTGMYEPQWYEQVHSSTTNDAWNGVPGLMKWQGGKGPSRIVDLNDLCGENGAKLVVTWNGFVDAPERAANFAKFCKDNNIVVDHWQFCNEPNFYTSDRRYFFNNGKDYARKMQEIADTIRDILPDASLALSYGWDGFGNFASGIESFDDWVEGYWNQVSVHSYAVHANDQTFEDAMLRVNRKVVSQTNDAFFDKVEQKSWNDASLVITEYGVWNSQLKNLYGGIYVSEYVTRMSSHPQARLIGKHQIKGMVQPEKNYKDTIWSAWENHTSINVNELPNSYSVNTKSKGLLLVNAAINNSSFVYQTTRTGSVSVPQMWGGETPAIYAQAYKGMNREDYLLLTNKSDVAHMADLTVNGSPLNTEQVRTYSISSNDPQANQVNIDTLITSPDSVVVPPYSVMRVEWDKDYIPTPKAPRIYSVEHRDGSVSLKWWPRESAGKYTVKYGQAPGTYDQSFEVNGGENHVGEITGLAAGKKYYFAVTASNASGESALSNEVSTLTQKPGQPVINDVHAENHRVTLHWESVPYANGYKVKYGTSPGEYTHSIDAGNVSGYVFRGLTNNTPLYFTVVAYNGYGTGEPANEIQTTPSAGRPWAPYLLHGSENSSNGYVQLHWTASDSTHGATYSVFRSNSKQWSAYDTIARQIQDPQFTDKYSLESGQYYYRVNARNQVGESHFYSNIATINKSSNTQSTPVESIEVISSGRIDTIDTGEDLQMFALVEPDDAVEEEVKWEVNDPSVATIDKGGLLSGHSKGIVTVTAWSTDGSGVTGSKKIWVGYSSPATDLEDIDRPNSKVYPNPSSGPFYVQMPEHYQKGRYEVYNAQGNKVSGGKVTGNPLQLDLGGLSNGMYFIRIHSGEKSSVARISIR